ncbi:MAG: hypothetical protein ACN6OD_11865 [Alcaligenes sp.]
MNTTLINVVYRGSPRMVVRQAGVDVGLMAFAFASLIFVMRAVCALIELRFFRALGKKCHAKTAEEFQYKNGGPNKKGPAHSPGLDQFGCGGRI